MAPIQTFLVQLGIAKETTWGTPVAPSTADQFVPVSNLKPEDIIDPVRDEGYRGLASKTFAVNQGFRNGKVSFDMQVYPQIIGHFAKALLGGVDTVTGVGPYTHALPQLNTGLPPSYTLTWYDGTTASSRQLTGAYLESLEFVYSATGPLKAVVTFVGKYAVLTTKPTATYATDQPFIPWQNTAIVNGVANAKLIGATVSYRRHWEGQWGAGGSQDLTAGNVGPIDVTSKLLFYPADTTEIDLYRNGTVGQLQLNFLSGTNQLILNHQQATLVTGSVIDLGTDYVRVNASIEGIYNSTDGGSLKATVVNTKSTVY